MYIFYHFFCGITNDLVIFVNNRIRMMRSLEQRFQDDSRAVNSPSTTLENDDLDRSLDVARDDSGAVNSPSTTVGMTLSELRITVNYRIFYLTIIIIVCIIKCGIKIQN